LASSQTARWAAVAVFALASTCNFLDRFALSAAAPRIKADFHLTNTDFGWLLSAFSLAYALASPATGWFLDWLGLEIGIVWSVALWSMSAALSGVTRTFGQLTATRVSLGAFESAGIPAVGKLNALYLEPENRALGAAMTQVGIGIAGVAAPLLVTAFAGWRAPLFAGAALGFLWIPAWLIVRRIVPPWAAQEPPARKRTGSLSLLLDRRLISLATANVLWMVVYTLWQYWTTLYLTRSFGLSMNQANAYAWFPPIASMLGGFAGGWISRAAISRGAREVEARVSAIRISAAGCLVTLLAPLCPTPFLATLVIAASYFWSLAGSVNIYTIPVDLWGGERAGAAISVLVFAYGLMQFAVSPLIGFLVDRFGFTPVCWMVALPPLAAWRLLRSKLPEGC